MIVLLIVLYLMIGFIVSIISTYVDYRESWQTDIVNYLEYDFSLAAVIIIWLFWLFLVFWVFFTFGIKNLYMYAIMLLDKLYKKRCKKR